MELFPFFVRNSNKTKDSLRFLLRLNAVVGGIVLGRFALETDGTYILGKSTLACLD